MVQEEATIQMDIKFIMQYILVSRLKILFQMVSCISSSGIHYMVQIKWCLVQAHKWYPISTSDPQL